MKKRLVIAMVTGIMVVSLAGCGTQADATDATVDDGDTIIVGEEDLETEADVTEESSETVSDEITETEVIGDDTEVSDFSGSENESIVLYAEIDGEGEYGAQKDKEFESVHDILEAPEDVPVFNGDGIEVGYIKSGSTISITGSGLNWWARFENPIEGTDYDYLYVMKDYIRDGNLISITATEVENLIKEESINRDYDAPVFTEVTDDMELYEFRIPMWYEEDEKPLYKIWSAYDKTETSIMSYKTYAVVCTEDTDDYIICKVYYKDLITDEEYDAYRKQQ